MIVPIRSDIPLRVRPWMNRALIMVNVVIFLVDWMIQRLGHPSLSNHLSLNARDPVLLHFFSYAFVHEGGLHLLGNMLALYIFGSNVNDRLGHAGYLAFYLAGAVFGGVGFVLAQDGTRVIGASGAVMAVMGAYLAFFPRGNITLLSILGAFDIPSMYLIVVFFLFELLMNFAGSTDVAHITHIAGTLFGFALAMSLLYLRLLPRQPWDFLGLVQRWHRRRQYQTLVRQGYNPFNYMASPPGHAARGGTPDWDPTAARIQDLRSEISETLAHHNLPHAAILFLELRALDSAQVLSRQHQLDIANQLASQQFYPQAADAYEQFLVHYPNFQQIEHVELMLGIIFARYLHRPDRARLLLSRALQRLHTDREIQMARSELNCLDNSVLEKNSPHDSTPDKSARDNSTPNNSPWGRSSREKTLSEKSNKT